MNNSIVCHKCDKFFSRKDSLKRHLIKHSPTTVSYMCDKCGKSFSRKENLVRHLRNEAEKEIVCAAGKKSECFHCSGLFKSKTSLINHIRSMHPVNIKCCKPKVCHNKCLLCNKEFSFGRMLTEHYAKKHNITLCYENLEFDSIKRFEEWQKTIECHNICHFRQRIRYKTASNTVLRLECHRSGVFRGVKVADERRRSLKKNGYKGLGGMCPAEITVLITEQGRCRIKYQKTHVGHDIQNISELKHIYTTKDEKLRIAEKIQTGIPPSLIYKQLRLSSGPLENITKLNLITRKDIRNIAVRHNLGFENNAGSEPVFNNISIEELIVKYKSDILFFKNLIDEDTQFGVFAKDDFVLIIMTENQELYLKRYSHKIVVMYGTHETNMFGFILHTLLVVNIDGEGLPVAFLLTNRNDQVAIESFLQLIKNRVGCIQCFVLITDTQLSYYNSWVKIMTIPQHFLFCTWHVWEAWRNNFNKIKNREKKIKIRKELIAMIQEMDPIIFEEKLRAFVSSSDQNVKDFHQYFVNKYSKNAVSWACCYHKKAGFNANIHVEAFHRELKRNIAGGKRIQSTCQCLIYIFEYLDLMKSKHLEKEINGKIPTKLAILRSRHREALNFFQKDGSKGVTNIDNFTFLVNSFQPPDESCSINYLTVTKNEEKECNKNDCQLLCEACKLCFHEYTCTCSDASIGNNMCKHIHLLGYYLKSIQFVNEDDRLYNIPDYDDMDSDNISNMLIADVKEFTSSDTPSTFGKKNEPIGNQSTRIGSKDEELRTKWLNKIRNVIKKLEFGTEDFPPATWQELRFMYEKFFVQIEPTSFALRRKSFH